jgi:peptidyl-prolyl cis-trans isomerase C
VVALAIALAGPAAHADAGVPAVVRVGALSLTAADVARRLAATPPLELRLLGQTPAEIRRNFVDRVLVPELLYASEADRRGLGKDRAVAHRILDAHRRALVDELRTETHAAGVSEDDVQAYYAAHAGEYHQPERIRIWRILVNDEALARRLLDASRSVAAPERWKDDARANSVDEATKLRGGDLGFVHQDGHTDVPQLDVDPALYAGASKVRDGELVPDPVKEGTHFAVVWRRGTLPKLDRTLADEHDRIRDLLERERFDQSVGTLVAELRKKFVTLEDADVLDSLRVEDTPPAEIHRNPPPLLSADPVPRKTDRGLR